MLAAGQGPGKKNGSGTHIQGASGIDARFFDPKINLHKIFKNNNRLMKLSEIVYLYLDFTFSR
jgi:hypothetical protein